MSEKAHDELKRKTITLILTKNCNLNCYYCYETYKNRRSMSFETAKSIIDSEFRNLDGYDSVTVDFFGGEPFLEFELIKKVSEYLEKVYSDIPYKMFASTNGTLVHGKIQEWLIANPKFICGLSIDGTNRMHNVNRSNSFEQIDIDFFAKNYPYQTVKMTISPLTLAHLYEGVLFLHSKGFKIICNLAYGIKWSRKTYRKQLEKQLRKLIYFYLKNDDIEPCSILNTDIKPIGYDLDIFSVKKWCGVGTHMITYDTDGKKYPCQYFTPQSLGQQLSTTTLDFIDDIPIGLLDEKCQRCVFLNACPTCYGANYVSSGSIYHKDDDYCALIKIILSACAFYRAKQWEKGLLPKGDIEEQLLLRAIKRISSEKLLFD